MLDIASFLEKSPVIDVRSPAEYTHGHIPGAVNMPLFTNEERSVVGTLYLQKGSGDAIMKGLELVGPKLTEFVKLARELAPHGEIAIYCWRGGMRSNSMSWLLNTSGINSQTLEGGYKAYRRFIHDYFARPLNLVVIGGMTGSGKTEILEEIEKKGCQVIHLERLASHKGSVFGHLGMPPQPTTEQFENDLFTELLAFDSRKPVFVEDESLTIGRVFIPRPFYSRMSAGRFINLIVSFDRRVIRLLKTYAGGEIEMLADGIRRIEKRLGNETTKQVIQLIDEGNMKKAVEIVLLYYDKIYHRSMGMHKRQEMTEIIVHAENTGEIADRIIGVMS